MATGSDLIAAGLLNDPGYQSFLDWVRKGAKHTPLGPGAKYASGYIDAAGLSPGNEGYSGGWRQEQTPWGESVWKDPSGVVRSIWESTGDASSPQAYTNAPAAPAGVSGGADLMRQLADSSYFRSGQPWTKSSRDVEDAILALSRGGDQELQRWLQHMGYLG